MRFSRSFKSSSHCLPSPDGEHVATLLPSQIIVRSVQTLKVVKVIKLPQDLAGPVATLQWSPRSENLLVAVPDQIRVWSVFSHDLRATINHPATPSAKSGMVRFGSSDAEVCVCSALGLKFTIFDLTTSRAVEISNPKFYTTAAANRGFSFRPGTHHLALLTRPSGKDMISIHDPGTRAVTRSWQPDTIDAHGLCWSPDGKWLVVWESAAQGHRVLFYTPDGHMFKAWTGPREPQVQDKDYSLGPGVRLVGFSHDAYRLGIGDSSRNVYIFNMLALTDSMTLHHPLSIAPRETTKIWQEQVGIVQAASPIRTFLRATQAVSPPARPSRTASDSPAGCSLIAFDPSSCLLATRLEDAPSTVWVWDVVASELRAVLIFHTPVWSVDWHPTIGELLLVRCEGPRDGRLSFVWDPLMEGPTLVDLGGQLAESSAVDKSETLWLGSDSAESPLLFCTDGAEYALATLAEPDDGSAPWDDVQENGWAAKRNESPLELLPAVDTEPEENSTDDENDMSELDDTFHFKK